MLFLILAGLSLQVAAGPPEPEPVKEFPLPPSILQAADRIQETTVMKTVRDLCRPKFEGRLAGEKGARRAAEYIAKVLMETGLRPGGAAGTPYQTFSLFPGESIASSLQVSVGTRLTDELVRGTSYMPLHLPGTRADLSAPLTFGGYGLRSSKLKFDEYSDLDVKGRAVLVFSGLPWTGPADAWIRRAEGDDFGSLDRKARDAAGLGAVLLLVMDNPLELSWTTRPAPPLQPPDPRRRLGSTIPILQVTPEFAKQAAGMTREDLRLQASEILTERESRSRHLQGREVRFRAQLRGSADIGVNVVCYLPGRDPELRGEAVILGAHFDHLGQRDGNVHFGANDNASGVAALLEIASLMTSLREPPRRTVIFIAFGAEEIGRLGSAHYAAHPLVAREKTRLMINFDMVGRNEADHVFAVATRSSPELHVLHQQWNRHTGLRLTHPETYRLGLSDHTAFFNAGIPVMYLFGGKHPGYHSPEDTADKLVPLKIVRIARLAFFTAWGVAENRPPISYRGER